MVIGIMESASPPQSKWKTITTVKFKTSKNHTQVGNPEETHVSCGTHGKPMRKPQGETWETRAQVDEKPVETCGKLTYGTPARKLETHGKHTCETHEKPMRKS